MAVSTPSAESVATVLAGACTLGAAAVALRGSGWQNSVVGNRISVDNRICACLIDDHAGRTRWVVYAIGDQPPAWIVDTTATAPAQDDSAGAALNLMSRLSP